MANFELLDVCGTDIEPDYPYEPLTESVDWMVVRD
jgi:hypothetical protein